MIHLRNMLKSRGGDPGATRNLFDPHNAPLLPDLKEKVYETQK